jgi:tetratricopeptide (TPR) repeat protein
VAHGPYLFKGADEPVEVFEVGAPGVAPLEAPPNTASARRVVDADDDEVLGWRPAVGLEVPDRPQWDLEKRLGEGGFGEVWLARHRKLGTHRAFKFCFDADRLRSFKRELTLFRLLHDHLGDRPDIARIYEVKLDEPPYFLESEYTEGGNVKDWSDMEGGIDKVPLAARVEIVARVADAVAAAHSVGVLHKDIKPSNILIATQSGRPRPQLADFGIGIITDRSKLRRSSATTSSSSSSALSGFSSNPGDEPSHTGTRIYLPPEVIVGGPFTVQGDVYALGVLLYQMVVGDLHRPVAEGWERAVDDELLREDIAACVDGDPQRRLSSAADLTKRLRSLHSRREWRRRSEEQDRAAARRQRLSKLVLGASAGLVVLLGLAGAVAWREFALRRDAENQREIAEATGQFLANLLMTNSPDVRQHGRDVRVSDALAAAEKQLNDPKTKWRPEVEAKVRQALGSAYRELGEARLGEPHNRRAVELIEQIKGPDSLEAHTFRAEWARTIADAGDRPRAIAMLEGAVRALERLEGPDSRVVLSHTTSWVQVLLDEDRYAEAQPLAERVVDARRRLNGAEDPKTLDAINTYAAVLFGRGEFARALEQFRLVYDGHTKLSGPDHRSTIVAAHNLAALLYRTGDARAGAEMTERVLESHKRVSGPEHPRTLEATSNLGLMKYSLGNEDEGIALLQHVLEVRRRKLGPEHPDTLHAMMNVGNTLATTRSRFAEAEPVLREMLEVAPRVLAPDHSQVLIARVALAKTLGKIGRADEAEAMYRDVIDLTARANGPDHPITASHRTSYADFLISQRRWDEAAEHVQAALRVASSPKSPNSAHEAGALARLINIAEAKGDADSIAKYQARLDQLRPRQGGELPALASPATAPSTAPTTAASAQPLTARR